MRATVGIGLVLGLVLAATIAVSAAFAASPAVLGIDPSRTYPAPVLAIQQGLLPLDRILPVVQRTVPGRVLDVQVVGAAYRVKVLRPNGRVAQVMVDGRSGQVIRVD